MGTIANKLAKLKTTKAEIKAALEEAGQSVGDVFDTYPAAIRAVVSSGAKIATGSYVGTGKYGSGNPNSLTFEFAPKLLFITQKQGEGNFWGADDIGRNPIDCSILTTSYTAGLGFSSVSRSDGLSGYAKKTEDGKTITWYHSGNADSQANYAQYTYYYFAIG